MKKDEKKGRKEPKKRKGNSKFSNKYSDRIESIKKSSEMEKLKAQKMKKEEKKAKKVKKDSDDTKAPVKRRKKTPQEIREEMRALYSSDEIGLIVNCFTGFKSVFSYAELLTRIKQYFGGTVLERDTNSIVKDLYRIGFLGNYSKRTKKFRWNYKGDQDVIIADEWFLFVHRALQPALSVENNFEDGLRRKKRLQSGQTVEATVIKRKKDRIIVNFEFDGKVIIGSYLADPNLLTENAYAVNPLCKGDQIVVKLVRYNKKYSSWDVKRVRTS